MKIFRKIIILITFLILSSCAQTKHIQGERTIDHFNTETGIYYNNSIPVKISFTKEWVIYSDTNKAPKDFWGNLSAMEKKINGEIAMVGNLTSMFCVGLLIEKNIINFSPTDYVKIIKEVNDYENSPFEEKFLTESNFDELPYADWKYSTLMKIGGVERLIVYRELVFLTNGYGCRLRFWTLSSLFDMYNPKIDEILTNISFD
jgi:hypothetical protein